MSTPSVLAPTAPVERSSSRSLRLAAIAVAALVLVIGAFALGRAVAPGTTHSPAAVSSLPATAPAPAPATVHPASSFSSPDAAALANEFAPGSFGARPGPATPTASGTPADSCVLVHGAC